MNSLLNNFLFSYYTLIASNTQSNFLFYSFFVFLWSGLLFYTVNGLIEVRVLRQEYHLEIYQKNKTNRTYLGFGIISGSLKFAPALLIAFFADHPQRTIAFCEMTVLIFQKQKSNITLIIRCYSLINK